MKYPSIHPIIPHRLRFPHRVLLLSLAFAALAAGTANASTLTAWGRSWNQQGEVPSWVQDPVAVAAGRNHNLYILADGTVGGWGQNWLGEASPPPETHERTVAFAAGDQFSLALLTNGQVITWGSIGETPAGISNIVAVAAGFYHCLAVRGNGQVLAWGENGSGQTNANGVTNAVAVAGMGWASLALRRDGTVAAWGDNSYGQLDVPPGLSNVTAVAGGSHHALALRADGTVVAWGLNNVGQADVPAGLSGVSAIAAGGQFSLALLSNGTVAAWGANDQQQTNLPSGLTNILAIACGEAHGLALGGTLAPVFTRPLLAQQGIFDSTVSLHAPALGTTPLFYSWRLHGTNVPGANEPTLTLSNLDFTQAGNYMVTVSNSVGSVTGVLPLSVVALHLSDQPASQPGFPGGNVTFRVGVESALPRFYQWRHSGTNLPNATNATLTLVGISTADAGSYTVLASNRLESVLSAKAILSFPPVAVWGEPLAPLSGWPPDLSNVVSVSTYGNHAVALRQDGTLVAWGDNEFGQTNVPPGLAQIVAVAAGPYHNLALRSDGTVAGWGQLPDWVAAGGEDPASIPPGLNGVVAIACGAFHSLALRTNGTVTAWGKDWQDQTSTPLGLDNVVAVAAGERHSLALRADGRVVAWGDNSEGQLDVPAELTNAVAIAAGSTFGLALRSDGTLATWGRRWDGTNYVPLVPPTGLSNILSIAAGGQHGLARTPRNVVGFGDNSSGQIDVPAYVAISGGIACSYFASFAVPAAGPPFLTTRLADRSQRPGGTVYFRVEGTAARRMSFQWHRNGIPLPGQTNAILTLANLAPADAGNYSVTASNALGMVTLPPARLTVARPPLEVALGTNVLSGLVLGGDAAWFAESAVTHDGVSAAQSGPIAHLQESWMQTTVQGPVVLSFWWKVSSEAGYDFLEFHLDDTGNTPTLAISGETAWTQKTFTLSAGTHLIGWRYVKDVFDNAGQDAGWVDEITLAPIVETDAELRLLSFTRDRVITWSSTRLNIYVGFQYVGRLGDCFQDAPDPFWNILQTNLVQAVTLPESIPSIIFLRLIGSASPLPRHTYDVDALGLPTLVNQDWVELGKMGTISRFRSAAGGDYSDDFESCRSMQHQFEPSAGIDPAQVAVFAPVSGVVRNVEPNEAGAVTLVIESLQQPAFSFHLGNIFATHTVACGQAVTAGTQVGTFAGGGLTSSISVWVGTPTGRKLVSYFDVMGDNLFQAYQSRGVATRNSLIISTQARDSDPLNCIGDRFEGPGNLPNYVPLQ